VLIDGAADMEKEGMASPEDWQAVAKCDREMANMHENSRTGGLPDWPEYYLETLKGLGLAGKLFYSGVPVIVEGQTMGAFCLLGPR
jgi:hypothetical protein